MIKMNSEIILKIKLTVNKTEALNNLSSNKNLVTLKKEWMNFKLLLALNLMRKSSKNLPKISIMLKLKINKTNGDKMNNFIGNF